MGEEGWSSLSITTDHCSTWRLQMQTFLREVNAAYLAMQCTIDKWLQSDDSEVQGLVDKYLENRQTSCPAYLLFDFSFNRDPIVSIKERLKKLRDGVFETDNDKKAQET